MRKLAAAGLGVAVSLAIAAPAHALRCQDVFSKIRQGDSLAPFVVGDSVTVPAGKYLGESGFAVDAVACRTFAQGLAAMANRRLPDVVVVALGSNAGVTGAQLEQALELVGPFGRLVLVLPKALGGGPDRDGRLMRAFERARPDQVSTLDWPAYSAGKRGWFAPDGLHLTTDGARGFAQMIGEGVEFGPAEQVEPPPKEPAPNERPKPRRRAPRGDPAIAEFWVRLGALFANAAQPVTDLIARLIVDSGAFGKQDL